MKALAERTKFDAEQAREEHDRVIASTVQDPTKVAHALDVLERLYQDAVAHSSVESSSFSK